MARESCNLDKDEAEILKPSSPSSSSPPPPLLFIKPCDEIPVEAVERFGDAAAAAAAEAAASEVALAPKPDEESQAAVKFSHRCSICPKKVGFMGFRCRCGDLFCGRHRYSDAHDCSFDYKATGRAEISKANPLIRAAKIIKI